MLTLSYQAVLAQAFVVGLPLIGPGPSYLDPSRETWQQEEDHLEQQLRQHYWMITAVKRRIWEERRNVKGGVVYANL